VDKLNIAKTDRQWKIFISWLIGTAFSKFVIDDVEKYPWWVPISGITSNVETGNWDDINLPRNRFEIRRNPNFFLPDYLVCRQNDRGYDFAFVESKGTDISIGNRDTPLESWTNQARNAELLFDNNQVPVPRNIVVATRINPNAKKIETRRIVVRAWNRNTSEQNENHLMFAIFLAKHYEMISHRLGYQELGEVMEVARQDLESEGRVNKNNLRNIIRERNNQFRLSDLENADEETDLFEIRPITQTKLFNKIQNPLNLRWGDISYTARFTKSAIEILWIIINNAYDYSTIRKKITRDKRIKKSN